MSRKKKKKKNAERQAGTLPNAAQASEELIGDDIPEEQIELITLPGQKAEEVLVVDRSHLFGPQHDHYFEGFLSAEAANKGFLNTIYDPNRTQFAIRQVVENNPNRKQIIPYCVFTYSEHGRPYIFLMKRLTGSTEQRLHNLYSIGIGGHINPEDAEDEKTQRLLRENARFWRLPLNSGVSPEQFASPLWTGMKREFDEEVTYPRDRLPKVIGYINDDSNSVGKVHFGVVFLIKGGRPDIETNEPDQLEGRLVPLDAMVAEKGIVAGLESWSKILYPHVYMILAPEQTKRLCDALHDLKIPGLEDEHIVQVVNAQATTSAELTSILRDYGLTVDVDAAKAISETVSRFPQNSYS